MMTTLTEQLAAVPVASSEDEEAWLDARAEGVTASEVPHLSPSTRERILDDKLNGSTFRGNAHTRRGHEREPHILADLVWEIGGQIASNSYVWAAEANGRHLATPDGFQVAPDGTVRGVEAKSHEHGWTPPATVIPQDHYDQVQWGMHVVGLDEWVYAWEVMGPGGTYPDHVEYRIVTRDAARIAELVARADDFLAWVDDGAPVDMISDELAIAKARVLATNAAAKTAAAEEKAARAAFEALLTKEYPNAARTGWSHKSDDGGVTLARPARQIVLDEEAWADAEPAEHARYGDLTETAEQLAASARERFRKTTTSKPALRVTQPKGQKK